MEKSSSLWNVSGRRSSSGSTSLTRAQPASTSPTTLPCTRCAASLWRTRGESPEPVHCSSVQVRALLLSVFTAKKSKKQKKNAEEMINVHSSSRCFLCLPQGRATRFWFGTSSATLDIFLPRCTLSSARICQHLLPSALCGRWKR